MPLYNQFINVFIRLNNKQIHKLCKKIFNYKLTKTNKNNYNKKKQ